MKESQKHQDAPGPKTTRISVSILGERLERIVSLRDTENLTYKEIAAEFGVSAERARQLHQQALSKMEGHARRHEDPLYGLSVRARNCLRNRHLTDRDQIRAALKSGDLSPENHRTRNYGWTTHIEVCNWLDLSEPEKL